MIGNSRRQTLGVLLAVLGGVLALQTWLAVDWYRAGLFTFDDGFFDADTLNNLDALAHGWARRSMIHPHLANFFSVPIRAIDVLSSLTVSGWDRKEFREYAALLIGPAATVIAAIAMYRTTRLLTGDTPSSLVATALYATSFSLLLFGSIPEAFAISNALIALHFWYAASLSAMRSPGRWWIWSLLGFLLVSITITNAAVFFIIRGLHRRYAEESDWKTAIMQTSLQTLLVVGAAAGTGYLAIQLLGYQVEASRQSVDFYIDRFVSFAPGDIARNLANIGLTTAQAFVGLGEMTRALRYCADLPRCQAVYFSHQTPSAGAWLLGFGLLTGVALLGRQALKSARHEQVVVACLGVLLFNLGLHSVFGTEMFLFSPHWITPLFLLLVPLIHRRPTLWISVGIVQLAVNAVALLQLRAQLLPS